MSTHPGGQDLGRPAEDGTHVTQRPESDRVACISCHEFVASLLDYLESELTSARRRAFETHLATCPDCPTYLDAYRKTVALARSAVLAAEELAGAEPSPRLIQRILSTHGSGS